MTEIKEQKYSVSYDKQKAIVILQGALLLNGASAYEPILNVLKEAAENHNAEQLTIDIRGLTFLNSSGINMMTKLVMYVSDVKKLQLKVILIGRQQVAWQERLSINLQRLMPSMQTVLE